MDKVLDLLCTDLDYAFRGVPKEQAPAGPDPDRSFERTACPYSLIHDRPAGAATCAVFLLLGVAEAQATASAKDGRTAE